MRNPMLDKDALAADPDGQLVVVVDGAELLAWSGAELQPVWKVFGEARYADLAVAADGVWALDREGMLEHRRRADGEMLHRARLLQGAAVCIAAGGGVVIGAATDHVVVWRDRGPVAKLDLPGVLDIAIRPDRAALIDVDGSVTVLDLQTLTPIGRVGVGGGPSAVAWSREGYWLLAVQHRLRPVHANGSDVAPPRPPRPQAIAHLVSAGDGALWALSQGEGQVDIVGADADQVLGTITVQRKITGLAAAGRGVLFIGLTQGEVQRVDLLTGNTVASAPHEGRARVPWASEVRVDHARLRGLLARFQAGPAEIAVQMDDEAPAELTWFTVFLWAAVATFAVLLALFIVWYVLSSRGVL